MAVYQGRIGECYRRSDSDTLDGAHQSTATTSDGPDLYFNGHAVHGRAFDLCQSGYSGH